jgi:hypothetical protein
MRNRQPAELINHKWLCRKLIEMQFEFARPNDPYFNDSILSPAVEGLSAMNPLEKEE